MTLKVTLSDGQEKTEDVGSFNQVDDGTYTITACVYDGENKVTNELTKTITLTDGKYSVVGAEWISSTEQNMYADNGVIETRDVTEKDIEASKRRTAARFGLMLIRILFISRWTHTRGADALTRWVGQL